MKQPTRVASGHPAPAPPAHGSWLSRRLVEWFRANRRDLPWRHARTPYRVWLAELMLQQTRAATVVPYFERFVARYPDLRALAEGRLDDVLKLWEGLGYYRRAHHLKATAELLVRDGLGEIPADFERLSALPGIGRYSAGAIASLAFNQPRPIQDGNVRRVLCRFYAMAADPRSAPMQRWLWSTAEQLIPAGRAGEFNEALIELGAIVCTDRAPRCQDCPLRAKCAARACGQPERFPTKPPRKRLPHIDVVAGIIWRGRRILVTRRRDEAMLGGLWEFPGGKVEAGESLEQALHRELAEELGIVVRIERPFVAVDHEYSHFRLTLHTFMCRHRGGRARTLGCAALRWLEPGALASLAFPKADRVVLAALAKLPTVPGDRAGQTARPRARAASRGRRAGHRATK